MRSRVAMSLLGGVLVACAHPGPPVRAGASAQPATSEATRAAAAARPGAAEHPPVPPLPMVTSDDVPARDDASDIDAYLAEAESIQSDDIDGPGGIHVRVGWHPHTGNTHVAVELVITTAGGTLRFAEPPREEMQGDTTPPVYPLMERILAAGRNRWVLLGWTSPGEGMQTEHAWLIEDRRGPRVLDSLAWTTDRSHGGVAVEDAAGQVRIGIPMPELLTEDGEPALHNQGWWILEHGKQELSLDDLQRLPFSETHVMALRGYYNPPYQDEPSLRHWTGRFVWFATGPRFTLDRHPRNDRPAPRH